jgi:hypothetical protein
VLILLTLGGTAALLFGLSIVGDEARRAIGPRDRYAVRFADVRCEPPPGTARETFLTEVRYAGGVPATLQLLDPDLKSKLSTAFAAHPWVLSVDAVTVEPPDAVTVVITYRTPVLRVPHPTGPRVADAKGMLLPPTAPSDGMPQLLGDPESPPEVIARAAAIAAEYKPRTLERTRKGGRSSCPMGGSCWSRSDL